MLSQYPHIIVESPSQKNGIDQNIENSNRIFSCLLISRAGIILKLPQSTISTSQLIYHRFFFRRSMKEFNNINIAIISLLLGSKIDENQRILCDIILSFYHILKLKYFKFDFDPSSVRIQKWVNSLKNVELILLHELGYIIYKPIPIYSFFLSIASIFGCPLEMIQIGYSFLNDCFCSTTIVKHKDETLAAAALLWSSQRANWSLPFGFEKLVNTNFNIIIDVCWEIHQLYSFKSIDIVEYNWPEYFIND